MSYGCAVIACANHSMCYSEHCKLTLAICDKRNQDRVDKKYLRNNKSALVFKIKKYKGFKANINKNLNGAG